MMNKTIKAAIMLNCTYITDGDYIVIGEVEQMLCASLYV